MPYQLSRRNVLVTGGSAGLGSLLSTTFASRGCNIAINYFNRIEPAEQTKHACEKHGVKVILVKAVWSPFYNAYGDVDMSNTTECARAIEETIMGLGGLDIILANAGWTKFTNFGDLDAMDESEWDRCWATNVKSPFALLKAAKPIFEQNPDGGQMISTSSIAAISQSGSSMAYAVTKAAQVQLVKCLASTQGPKIRINTVSPGLLLTEWGLKYSAERIEALKNKAVLQHETYLDDCVNAFVMLAQNTSMTGMRIQVDAGLAIAGS